MRNIFLLAWFLSTILFLTLAIVGFYGDSTMVVFGLVGLASLYLIPLTAYVKIRVIEQNKDTISHKQF